MVKGENIVHPSELAVDHPQVWISIQIYISDTHPSCCSCCLQNGPGRFPSWLFPEITKTKHDMTHNLYDNLWSPMTYDILWWLGCGIISLWHVGWLLVVDIDYYLQILVVNIPRWATMVASTMPMVNIPKYWWLICPKSIQIPVVLG